MMREILFRGERIDNWEWVEGSLIVWPDGDTEICHTKSDVIHELLKATVVPETVGQFTGLSDKNGTKIFEGDIVRFAKNTYQIIFECGSFALLDKQGLMIAKIGGMNDHCYSLMTLYLECCWEENSAYDIEVIGNIHDNPDLLEK